MGDVVNHRIVSGHRAIASNVPLPHGYKPIVLETLSTEPRVFKMYNFFTEVRESM
jgi:hypothetical protein